MWMLLWCCLFLAVPASGQGQDISLEGRILPRTVRVGDTELQLHGTAVLRAGWIFKVYAAALYLPAHLDPARVLDDAPKRLEIFYLHDTDRKHMIDTAEKTLAKSLSPQALAVIEERVRALHEAYRDGRKGGYAALTYVPRQGLSYEVDGELVTRIEGADFAAAYFGVWLGETPSSRSVKRQLLERDAGSDR